MPERALLLAYTFPPRIGGRETYLYELFSRLDPLEVAVLTPQEEEAARFDAEAPFPILREPRQRWFWFMEGRRTRARWMVDVVRQLHLRRSDLLYCGVAIPDGLTGWLLARTLGMPYVVFTYAKEIIEPLNSPRLESWRTRVLREAETIITISRYARQLLREQGVAEEQIVIIPPGVDTHRFRPDASAGAAIRRRYHLGDGPLILTVARLTPRKGHDLVLRALPALLKQFPDLRYAIVGVGKDAARLHRLAQEQGVAQAVLFIGAVNDADLPGWYNAADLLVMPNRMEREDVEGFGIVFLEAAACGKPAIGGRSGGAEDAIVEGKTGYLVEPTSVGDLIAAVARLLADPQLAQAMGEAGRARVEREFTWERSAERLLALHRRLVACRRLRSPNPTVLLRRLDLF